jgi:hypothetical protein
MSPSARSENGPINHEREMGSLVALVDAAASGRERRESGKHRTEVTEATEGDWGWCVKEVFGRVSQQSSRTRTKAATACFLWQQWLE